MTYCNSCSSFRCRVGCTGKSAARQQDPYTRGYMRVFGTDANAKLADTALDSFDNTGAAAKTAHKHATLDEALGCDACQAELSKLTRADTALDSFRGSEAEPVKADAEPTKKPSPGNQMYQSMVATFDKCLSICERKSHDYARGENPYRNFEGSARIGVSVQKGLLVRLQDKFTRLENLIETEAQVSNETFEDTIDDLINYAAILKARREFERSTN